MDGVSVVVPTLGRPSLAALLRALTVLGSGRVAGAIPVEVVLVDDRPGAAEAAPLPVPAELAPVTRVVAGRAAGPAAARNRGWRAARYGWVAFLDDDVVPGPDWPARLATDLRVPAEVGGVQGRVRVPLPAGRRPRDWERTTAALAGGRWITADMAYRRVALAHVGGFDERFPRAYREDAELAYRVGAAGWRLVVGERQVTHPVRPQPRWASVRVQWGNADDALLRRLYGRRWRQRLGLARGRRPAHVVTTASGLLAVAATLAARHGRVTRSGPPARAVRAVRAVGWLGWLGWLAGTGQFALARIRSGPPAPAELAEMALTSLAIPPAATACWLVGWWRARHAAPWPGGPNW
ncbi:MAG TPA: glycosyltransferase [Natronosporangium sp.]|nr:glycosyltransferase [Natronosporangium sp.]